MGTGGNNTTALPYLLTVFFPFNNNYKKCQMEEKVIKNIRPDEHEYLRLNIWDTGYSQKLQSVSCHMQYRVIYVYMYLCLCIKYLLLCFYIVLGKF